MCVDIKRAEVEQFGRVQKFTPSRIPRHPANLQSPFRGEMHSALHGNGDGAARSKNRDAFTARSGREKLRETGVDSGAEFQPSLHVWRRNFAADPLTDDRFKQLLKSRALFGGSGRRLKSRVKISDSLVLFKQGGQAAFQHFFSLVFVKLRKHQRLRELETRLVVGYTCQFEGVSLADTGTDSGAIKGDPALHPVLAEKPRLRFTEGGQLVIIFREK